MAKKDGDVQVVNEFAQKLGIPQCSFNEAKKVIKLSFECGNGHVPVLISEAGTGKSQVARQIAHEIGARAAFFFLAHVEPEDIGGVPYPDEKGASYRFLCEESMLEIITSDEPTVLVLDEWNRGDKNVMNAAFTMMEDRRFGSHTIPDHVHIMACMNPSEGSYLVNEAEKDPAFRRRMCFLAVRTDPAVWLEYATGDGKFHPMVTGFIQSSQSSLMDVNAREAGKVSANPASWEKVSQTLYTMEKMGMDLWDNKLTLKLKLSGHIGMGMADNFIKWGEENTVLVNPEDVIKHYGTKKKGVRAKVRKLVKGGRTDLLNEACEGVALMLMTQQPEVDEIAENLGLFASDLSVEFAKALFQKFAKYSHELQKDQYFVQLSTGMSKVEAYRKSLQKIHDKDALLDAESEKDSKKEKED